MSSLLYYSIESGLTKDEIIAIDKEVVNNRKAVYKFIRRLGCNSKRKARKLLFHTMLLLELGKPLAPALYTVIVPLPTVIKRLSPIEQDRYSPKIVTIPVSKVDKIRFTKEQIKELNNLVMELNSGSLTMEEAILKLRGGEGWTDLVSLIAFIIFCTWFNDPVVEGFEPITLSHQDLFGLLSGKYSDKNVDPYGSRSKPMTRLKMQKPTLMPQQEYSGLTKSQRRKLPDPLGRDSSINLDGYPRLELRFNQVEYKTPKHGKDHGLPISGNGKTPKTEANVIALRDSLVDMGNNENTIWYTDGQYQGGTERGCNCVNLFDQKKKIIAVYEKQADGSNLFLTTCKLDPIEVDHLEYSNGNFVSKKILSLQNWVKGGMGTTPREMDITPIGMGTTPREMDITPMDPAITPMDPAITPISNDIIIINNSQSNNP